MYKAMFPGRRLSWQEVTVAKSANGLKPELQVDAIAAAASPPPSHSLVCHLSISHDGDYIVAYVIAEGTPLLCSSCPRPNEPAEPLR